MTADERIEALLNRCGQTISDLPRKWDGCVSEPDSGEQCYRAHGAAWAWYVGEDQRAVPELERQESTRDRLVLRSYILHLTDVIDRMETALENLLNERDWMIREMRDIGFCDTCYFHRFSTEFTAPPECDDCDPNSKDTLLYTFGGVPDDWRLDDD